MRDKPSKPTQKDNEKDTYERVKIPRFHPLPLCPLPPFVKKRTSRNSKEESASILGKKVPKKRQEENPTAFPERQSC